MQDAAHDVADVLEQLVEIQGFGGYDRDFEQKIEQLGSFAKVQPGSSRGIGRR